MDTNRLIAKEFKIFEEIFDNTIDETELSKEIISYIKQSHGKRLRPKIILILTKIFSEINDFTYRAAVLIELIHFSSLLHDDVIDNAKFRRKRDTINSLYDDKTAILIGDYLFSFSLKSASDYHYDALINIIANTIKDLSLGELLELEISNKNNFDEEKYYKTIKLKTASLISSCFEITCLAANIEGEKAEKIKEIGNNFGLLFQIIDDILDYIGKDTGKTIGIDIENNKITLPLILALKNMTSDEKNSFLCLWNSDKRKENIKEIIKIVIDNKGIIESKKVVKDILSKIISDIDIYFPKNEYSKFLRDTILEYSTILDI